MFVLLINAKDNRIITELSRNAEVIESHLYKRDRRLCAEYEGPSNALTNDVGSHWEMGT